MNIVGYIVALTNLQAFGGHKPDLKGLSISIGNFTSLAQDLQNYPEFNKDGFQKNRVYRVGNMGLYLSNNFREYYLHGIGNPGDEGTVITFTYKNGENDDDGPNLSNYTLLIRKKDMPEDFVKPILQDNIQRMNYRNRVNI
ncbi:uncharacterized protein LOC111355718 [Spodoptera litura]|uniref:Uncharacterized protein LOC111355718 n=1 Tax=Spodoptera litura TaxID=69820 RepID=A0A9J7E6X9_SPOLT|nr:uncharacterized protein LOC111355718 [Spodoptera litura]